MEKHSTEISKFPKSPVRLLLLLLLLVLTFAVTGDAKPESYQILYSQHCDGVVPEAHVSPDAAPVADPSHWLTLNNAHLFDGKADGKSGRIVRPKVLHFVARNVYRTQTHGIYKLEGFVEISLSYRAGFPAGSTRRGLRLVYFRPPRFPKRVYPQSFPVTGFWNSVSGELCMVSSGLKPFGSAQVGLKLNYLNSSSIFDSLVNGSFLRFDAKNGSAYSKPRKILGFSLRNYRYTLIDEEVEKNGFNAYDRFVNSSLGFSSSQDVCLIVSNAVFDLEYSTDCNGVNCDFLGGISSNSTPRVMSFKEIECSKDGRVRYMLLFSDQRYNYVDFPFLQNATLVAEGKWEVRKKRIDMVVCRILNGSHVSSEGSVGDCTIRVSLRLPSRWTLRERSVVVGNMWSTKSSNELGYFKNVVFRSMRNRYNRPDNVVYEYTEIEKARRSCANKMISKGKEAKYPEAHSSDMRFNTILRNKKGVEVLAYSSPMAVGETFFKFAQVRSGTDEPTALGKDSQSRVFNISYVLSFKTPDDFVLGGKHRPIKSLEISAEGLYDSKTGHLCMIGCMHSAPNNGSLEERSLDCEVRVDIQYPPLNAKAGTRVRGTIESLRVKSDSLYFEPLEIFSNSLYAGQARESIWRMDLEMTLVLISNTLACVFVGLQLFYVKKYPNVLPSISVIMLFLLTLAHMVPLLLNFEALFFANRNKQNVYLGGGGWLEVNEVLVRVITMVAFLLEFRLLQLTWSARAGDENQKSFWTADKKVLFLSLPLYVLGGLIAWLIHLSRKPYQRRFALLHRFHRQQQQNLWVDLKSYAGLILDGFLLPQILFNLFCDTSEKALAPSFYLGSTLVRLLPHVYDLYRAHSSTWTFDFIYANPKLDFYSTSWDIIICCGGLLFVSLIFLQQRFGGGCFLPRRFRERTMYEKVPMAISLSDKSVRS
ncbi:uncharacterized protein LOC116032494 [Ipomoea triloba]|uniref:uncharacterized protein LOC116032494 n=1 Tax=Ipomoea triloba TaxID=35885 RepID=UPI00125E5158|nr:uncharacterized protein LOC116032494 [Ipomoea triloba]